MQRTFWNNCNHRWNIKEGATRSGKTYMDYFLIAKRLRESHGKAGLRVLIGNTRSTLERNIIDPMRDIWGKNLIGTLRQNNTIEMFGEKVYALGADKVSQVTKLQGSGMIYCYGDEITTWNKDVFQMLKSRLSYKDSRFDGTCNPDSPNHWFREFLNSKADIFRQSYQIYDNPFLDKQVIKDLELEYDGTVYYDRFILGKWALAEGLIYQCFHPDRDTLDQVTEPLTGKRIISCDYGTSNPCVFLLFEQGASGVWYLTREYYYSGRDQHYQKTDEEYCRDMKTFIGDLDIYRIIVDPSAASFIAALRANGLRVAKANNNVPDGIRKTMVMLNKKELKILRSCSNTIRELGSYCWDDKKTDDTPLKVDDHCPDAIRYFVNYHRYLDYDPFK